MECSTNNNNILTSIYICDKCRQSQMNPTGRVLLINPPIYEHKCEMCGEVKEFRKCYPSTTIVTNAY